MLSVCLHACGVLTAKTGLWTEVDITWRKSTSVFLSFATDVIFTSFNLFLGLFKHALLFIPTRVCLCVWERGSRHAPESIRQVMSSDRKALCGDCLQGSWQSMFLFCTHTHSNSSGHNKHITHILKPLETLWCFSLSSVFPLPLQAVMIHVTCTVHPKMCGCYNPYSDLQYTTVLNLISECFTVALALKLCTEAIIKYCNYSNYSINPFFYSVLKANKTFLCNTYLKPMILNSILAPDHLLSHNKLIQTGTFFVFECR